MKFKIGDRVKFVNKTTGSSYDPPLGSVHTILKVCPEENSNYPYKWNKDNPNAFFGDNEIILDNSSIIREKLGIK